MGCNTSKDSVTEERTNGHVEKVLNHNENERKLSNAAKPESARTVTLSANGSLIRGNLDQAATKIQAAFRGHQSRKSMKQSCSRGAQGNASEKKPTDDDQSLSEAATKIQASFRGHLTRKQMEQKDNAKTPETSQEKKNDNEEELDIDLSDPDLNKAAVKIQASFRGHMVRKENEPESKEK